MTPKTPKTCPDCNGTGEVTYALDQTDPSAGLGRAECDTCNGYGVLTP